MKKTLFLFTIVVIFSCDYDFANAQSSTLIQLAPGVTTPTVVKTSTSSSRVAASIPALCDAQDIRIFPSALPQSEIHISINKKNPQVLLLSSQTFPTDPIFSWQGSYWSTNGGLNWVGADVLPNNVSGRGDPSTAFDAAGNGYVSSMARAATSTDINDEPVGLSLLKTANTGTSWTNTQAANNINGFDKDMIAADDTPGSPFVNNVYASWSVLPTSGPSSVGFNRSTDGGNTFSAPISLKSGWGQGTNIQTGPNGDVYVCWANYTNGSLPAQGLGFARSTNGGVSFPPATIPFTYTGIRKSSGPDWKFRAT